MQPSPRNGRPKPHRGNPGPPAPSHERHQPARADGPGDGRTLPARPGESPDPDRSSREALMDCYNG
jgi:hypothetical protein